MGDLQDIDVIDSGKEGVEMYFFIVKSFRH